MKTRRLGRTGLEVSPLGIGCYQLTGEFRVPRDEAARILALAARSGVRLVDTAPSYGAGESEELVGRALAADPDWDPVVSTKVGRLDTTIVRTGGDDAYVDPELLERAVMHSLWLLRRDRADIVMVHEPDWPQWRIDAEAGTAVVFDVLDDLRRRGVIGHIGVGGWDSERATALVRTGRVDVVLAAGGLSLIDSTIHSGLLEATEEHDAGLIVGGAFGQNSRFLIQPAREDVRTLAASEDPDRRTLARKLELVYELSDQVGIPLPELAVRYILSIPQVHSHIAGARETGHLASNLAAVEAGPLEPEVVKAIEDIHGAGEIPDPLAVARLARGMR